MLEVGRQFLIVAELFGVDSAAAREGTELAGVSVEFLGWSLRMNDLKTTASIHPHDLATPA
jgi:hypothetical protein